jgi:hypothetical protein
VLGKGILPSSKQAAEAIDLNRYLERWKALQGKSKGQDGKAYKRIKRLMDALEGAIVPTPVPTYKDSIKIIHGPHIYKLSSQGTAGLFAPSPAPDPSLEDALSGLGNL